MTRGASHSGGRRPKSAEARSRGKFGAGWASERYGDLIFAPAMMVGGKLAPGNLDGCEGGLEACNGHLTTNEKSFLMTLDAALGRNYAHPVIMRSRPRQRPANHLHSLAVPSWRSCA